MKETVGNDYKPFRRIRVLKIIISPRFILGKIDCGSFRHNYISALASISLSGSIFVNHYRRSSVA